jgi:hypothetical protein
VGVAKLGDPRARRHRTITADVVELARTAGVCLPPAAVSTDMTRNREDEYDYENYPKQFAEQVAAAEKQQEDK